MLRDQAERLAHRRRGSRLSRELVRLGDAHSDPERVEAKHGRDPERDSPAILRHLLVREDVSQQRAETGRGDRADSDADPGRARPQTAASLRRDLGEIGEGGSGLATVRQTLHEAREDEDDGRERSHHLERRRDGDDEAADRRERDREREAVAAPLRVGNLPEDPSADRSHEETDREDGERREQAGEGVVVAKELRGEERREDRVDVPVEPLERIADIDGDQIATTFSLRHGGPGDSSHGHILLDEQPVRGTDLPLPWERAR